MKTDHLVCLRSIIVRVYHASFDDERFVHVITSLSDDFAVMIGDVVLAIGAEGFLQKCAFVQMPVQELEDAFGMWICDFRVEHSP